MMLTLWPDEIESMREESRKIVWSRVEEFRKTINEEPVGAGAPSEQLIEQRRRLQRRFLKPSPEGSDASIGGVRCRTFRPDAGAAATYVHFHGGGMSIGAPEMSDGRYLEISRRFGINVVSVDYRLAPEHPYPAGLDDCISVVASLLGDQEFGEQSLILGGESSGAYFAAAVALRVRDELGATGRVRGLNLVYGGYDLGGTPSALGYRIKYGPNIAGDNVERRYLTFYTPGLDEKARRDSRISPMFADLRGLPPAFFTVGTLDHVFDDTMLMASRWTVSGNQTELFVAPDMPHGFNMFPCPITTAWKQATDRWFSERLS